MVQKQKQKGARLRWFMVDPDLRGHGFGKVMLDVLISFAKDRSFESIYLTTLQGLEPAGQLYHSVWFRTGRKVYRKLLGHAS